jgi:hypothetical protein
VVDPSIIAKYYPAPISTRPASSLVSASSSPGNLSPKSTSFTDFVPTGTASSDSQATPKPGWQSDVDGDGLVTPRDALLVVNALNRVNGTTNGNDALLDVNDDGMLTPLDALLVINDLNNGVKAEGEAMISLGTNTALAADAVFGDTDDGAFWRDLDLIARRPARRQRMR